MTAGRTPDRAPHVLFVASAAEDYGADRMLLQSVRALTSEHRVTVVLPMDGTLRPRLEAAGAAVQVRQDFALRRKYLTPPRIPGLLMRNLRALAGLAAVHRREPIDLVVTNTEAVVLGGALAWVIGRPHVWHVHEIVDTPPLFARLMAALIHRLTDRVIACSDAVEEHLVSMRPGLASRITVVTNAIPIPPTLPVPAPGSNEALRVGCVGRIHARKGQRQLVDAWAGLAKQRVAGDPALELHFFGEPLAGEDHLVEELQVRLDEAGCGTEATFHGFVRDPDVIYPGLDLVVVPSIEPESFSLVCAEAQAYGVAVIGPDGAGPAATVQPGWTGLLVDPTDVQALTDAMTRLLADDDERRAFGSAGRRWARAAFSLDRYHDEIRTVIGATILGTAPAPRAFTRTSATGGSSGSLGAVAATASTP